MITWMMIDDMTTWWQEASQRIDRMVIFFVVLVLLFIEFMRIMSSVHDSFQDAAWPAHCRNCVDLRNGAGAVTAWPCDYAWPCRVGQAEREVVEQSPSCQKIKNTIIHVLRRYLLRDLFCVNEEKWPFTTLRRKKDRYGNLADMW